MTILNKLDGRLLLIASCLESDLLLFNSQDSVKKATYLHRKSIAVLDLPIFQVSKIN